MTPAALTTAGALAPLLVAPAFLVATLVVFTIRCFVVGRTRTVAIGERPPSFLLKWLQEWWVWLWSPVEWACIRLGVSPNTISVVSAAVVAIGALALAAGALSIGGWLYVLGASLDLVDGRVARATGRCTRSGAFLDSTLDRVTELLVLSALAVQFRHSPVLYAALAAAAASVLVSYARARGEALGAADEARVGGMQRAERVAVVGVACAISPVADELAGPGAGRMFVGAALTAVAVLASATALRRAIAVFRGLRASEPASRDRGAAVRVLRPGRRDVLR